MIKNSLSESYKEVLQKADKDYLVEFAANPNEKDAAKGIKTYFASHEKKSLFNAVHYAEEKLLEKSCHMVSAFALGLICSNLLESKIKNIVKDNSEEAFFERINFGDKDIFYEYFWFLCCLSHDILSFYERNEKDYVMLDDFIKDNNISYTIYNQGELEEYDLEPFIHTYEKEVVERYFEKRAEQDRTDHGVAGGYYFFDKLVKNYISARKQDSDKELAKEFFFTCTENGHCVYWHPDQMWIMAYVADAIIAHNIWHGSYDDKLLKCITYGEDEEILLNIDDHPLAFMLGLVDAIEPLKRFHSIPNLDILKNISITYKEKSRKVVIAWTDIVKSYSGFLDWLQIIYSLKDWMSVEISTCRCEEENYSLEIEIL